MSDMNRRGFLAGAAATAAAACVGCMCSQAMAGGAGGGGSGAPAAAADPVGAGALDAFAKDGVFDTLAQKSRVVLVRKDNKLYALTAVCTHQGGTVVANNGALRCPKHNATFALDGKNTGGPARTPLVHLGIKVDDKKHVVVDPSKKLTEAQWNDEGSFVKV
jgi:cytochrome b6-f complex iron-sulfur subunit